MRCGSWTVACAGLLVFAAGRVAGDDPPKERYVLVLDGTPSGYLERVDPALYAAHPVQEPAAAGKPRALKAEPLKMEMGMAMAGPFYEWLKPRPGGASRKNGAIVACDFAYEARSEITFSNALLTEIQFPALDARGKDTCYLTVKIEAEIIGHSPKRGKQERGAVPGEDKSWLPCNFRLEIEGVDCSGVDSIASFTIRERPAAEARAGRPAPRRSEVAQLAATFPGSAAAALGEWQKNAGSRRSASLVILGPDRKAELLAVLFPKMGIKAVAAEQGRVKAEMHCEDVQLRFR